MSKYLKYKFALPLRISLACPLRLLSRGSRGGRPTPQGQHLAREERRMDTTPLDTAHPPHPAGSRSKEPQESSFPLVALSKLLSHHLEVLQLTEEVRLEDGRAGGGEAVQ